MRIVRLPKAPEAPETVLDRFLRARHKKEEAEAEYALAEAALIDDLRLTGRKTATYNNGEKTFRATYTSRQTTQIDEAGLKKALGAAGWKAVSKSVLDRTKLEEAVTAGKFAAETVGQFISLHEGKASIRYSVSANKEADSA